MSPDPRRLLATAGIATPLIGFYDAPDPAPFAPLVEPEPGRHVCVFAPWEGWLRGETLHLTKDNFGCGGAGHWLWGVASRGREDFVRFLVDGEGLKASPELMHQWLDHHEPYLPEHAHLLIGPLREGQAAHLKTVTFWVDADQLSLLMTGAQYYASPGDPPPVLAPFGSGCMELLPLFEDLSVPQAIIGATDIAMRGHLPPGLLAFTVTVPMFERLCALDERSFLDKPFWQNLRRARAGAAADGD
ncbi:MAG: DUF169 domain-containing protein [Candidatus Krumholzibacteriota bacterium]|nr:DUF169 domain-containing protein [Candidatus Krumholzibacteriota bacterium]